jgi:hypothetical protein
VSPEVEVEGTPPEVDVEGTPSEVEPEGGKGRAMIGAIAPAARTNIIENKVWTMLNKCLRSTQKKSVMESEYQPEEIRYIRSSVFIPKCSPVTSDSYVIIQFIKFHWYLCCVTWAINLATAISKCQW